MPSRRRPLRWALSGPWPPVPSVPGEISPLPETSPSHSCHAQNEARRWSRGREGGWGHRSPRGPERPAGRREAGLGRGRNVEGRGMQDPDKGRLHSQGQGPGQGGRGH